MIINIAADFSDFLVNRDEYQGDGTATGVDFRAKFLGDLEKREWWGDPNSKITLDFTGVDTIGPSWANEVFAYYTVHGLRPEAILKKIILREISSVKLRLIRTEIESGYKRA